MCTGRSFAAAIAVLLLGAWSAACQEWEPLPPLRSARQEVGVAALEGRVYVIGGILADRSATGIVERYDAAARRWNEVAPLPDGIRLHHVAAVAAAGRIYSIGGLDASFRGRSDVFAFDPATGGWSRAPSLPRARGAMGAAVVEGIIYAAGGQSGSRSLADLAALVPGEASWRELDPLPAVRNHLAAVSIGGLLVAISGRAGGRLLPDVDAYDPALGLWHPLAPIPTPRGGIAAAALAGRIYVFGGEGNPADPAGVFPHVEVHDLESGRWERTIDMAVPRHGIGAAVIGGRIFIPGGSPRQGFGVTAAHDAFTPAAVSARFVRGDANGDRSLDISDAIFILARLFLDTAPLPCEDAADANDDGAADIADAIFLLAFLFRGGPAPPPPGGDSPGEDPTPDELGCERG